MAFLAFLLLATGIGDLVRGTPDSVSVRRAAFAAGSGTVASAALAAIGGFSLVGTLALAATLLVLLTLWGLAADDNGHVAARAVLVSVVVVIVATIAVSGSAPDLEGDLKRWYESLPFAATARPPLPQFVVGLATSVFLIASANRVVRLILTAANAELEKGEEALKGGRWLGALERLLVAGVVLAGEPTGAAVVIAAKSIIRIPEVTGSQRASTTTRAVTEYFLIGTLSSLLTATALAALVLASG
jgi:hypothetical protein